MNNETPPHQTPISRLAFIFILCSAFFSFFLPNLGGMKTRSSSPFAVTEVQMRPLIIIPDVATQAPTFPTQEVGSAEPSWWKKHDVASNLEKIARAIKGNEAMTNHRMRSNTLHPDRLTLHTKDGDVFVEIKNDVVRVGDLVDGKQIVGTIDGSMPTSGVQDTAPDDSIGYPPSISGNDFGQRSIIAVPQKAYNQVWYEDTIRRIADEVLTPP